ncbi:hypothetical protein JQ597_19215 [Bradyrhizobium sp. AUGA SZCCT0177]|uniref:hypothetical protein n=1 Tax=Bradyrhizobium sp. AUGA SZCCT0177 TaxID=2807665 RepID=UPI001BA5E28E|nr:hypothetical protein [Bradyrhizobium sp. AUGA SZCCT0177]MBR1284182.1 hypothetical protein [Bradyrhizobium sp. AUGA SZCCT0177]
MPAGHGMQGGPSDIRRASPAEFLLLTERIAREARTARAAAIGDAVVRTFTGAVRGVRVLVSVVRTAFALRDTLMPAREGSRTHHPNHHQ